MATLRSKLIRLAHANPSLRADILPLVTKTASFKTLKAVNELAAVIHQIHSYLTGEGLLDKKSIPFPVKQQFMKDFSRALLKHSSNGSLDKAIAEAAQDTVDFFEEEARSQS